MSGRSVVFLPVPLLLLALMGCGGSEYRFGNQKPLPNLSGQWTFSATSQTMSQQFHGTGSIAQSNLALQGSVSTLFNYCAPSANISGTLTATQPFDTTSTTSYTLTMVMQEQVADGGVQEVDLEGSASADGTRMSGTYTASGGSCTTGDSGVWSASK